MTELGQYDPKAVEEKWSRYWVERALYHAPKPSKERKFSVVIPPPNVTGSLHMGHALNATLQDVIVRWQRMLGRECVWVPGFDHAGIATQYVVEKQLSKEGLSRLELGREAFLKKVWEWVPKSREAIRTQLTKLGVSVDWKRERFTLDEGFSRAVRKAFKELYEEGLIYRAEYIVNWCPKDRTALSDLEVEYEDEPGALWYVSYPVVDDEGKPTGESITVATTRPETMLGDTAVAVHPEDERYKHLIGKRVKLPLVDYERTDLRGEKVSPFIPIVADRRVKKEFGTGAVKITPAHDPLDFEIGRDHGLPFVRVIDEEGKMTENAGEFAGMDRYEAREAVVAKLKELELLEREEEITHAVGHCYRCKTVVEPMVSRQWFVKVSDPRIKEAAVKAGEEGLVRFIPERWRKFYLDWMYNLRDWCISRQIWWGHRIPVWYCRSCSRESVFTDDELTELTDKLIFNLLADGKLKEPFTAEEVLKLLNEPHFVHPELTVKEFYERFVYRRPVELPTADKLKEHLERSELYGKENGGYRLVLRCKHCGSSELEQDSDVLDTWFSSALWPFGVFGWPEETEDLKTLYPTDLLVTGFDIIFFWVARMIMMGTHFMREVPFYDVYVHALVRDKYGRKMSKTLGNVIDPLDVIERYGADALRFTLAVLTVQGRDIKLAYEKFEGYRHFINKLWNAARFVLMNLPSWPEKPAEDELSAEDKWVLTRLSRTARKVNEALKAYEFSKAAQALYDFTWSDFCDWYIEFSKIRVYRGSEREKKAALYTLATVLETVLRLLHPFTPFVTEELWHRLPFEKTVESISLAPYPQPSAEYPEEEALVERVKELISAVRALRSALKIKPSEEVLLSVKPEEEEVSTLIERFGPQITRLARVKELRLVTERPPGTVATFVKGAELYLHAEGLVNVEELLSSYRKKREKLLKELERVNRKLSNEQFLKKAPPEVVEKERGIKEELEQELNKLEGLLEVLERGWEGS
ncbi:MAG: valine--tRNA ligase [Aquificae bacterium]|nr:valine--tRNA ligase [Aquificota bacterium]